VVARSLTFQYKAKPVDVRQLGAQWAVSHVVEGSVRRGGGRVRVSVQVINVADGYQLWSQTYDRPARDLFGIQEEVARAVAGALRVRLRRPARELFTGRYTENLEVYNRFLLARYYQNRYSLEPMLRARDELQSLLQLEPRYAPAMAALSTLYALLGYYAELPPREAWGKVKDYARQAIAADPAMAEAYASLSAAAGMSDWDWKACEENGRRALDLDPSSAEARVFYAIACLAPQGKLAEAEQQLRQSLELDPLLVFGNYTYAFTLLAQGKYEPAVERYRRTLDLKDDHPDIWWDYGMALGYARRYQEAASAFERNRALHKESQRPPGAAELVFMGRPEEAREQARQRVRAPLEYRGWQMDLARDLALAGEVDAALDALDRAVTAHEPQAVWIKVDPRLAAVRNSPRYLESLHRIGL
jgi:serine/threonine-protein kinase